MDIAEFILKMFTIGFLIAGILGMILQTINFQGNISFYDNERLAIDFANAAAAAPCLAEKVDNNFNDYRKGTLDSAKFEEAKRKFCLKLDKPYKITITRAGIGKVFSIEQDGSDWAKLQQPMPVTIKSNGQYFAGVLDVEIGK